MKETDITWAAGIFEGEGTCGISKTWGQPAVSITSTDKDVVEKFTSIMGVGRFYVRKDGRKASYKPAYKWAVQSRDDVIKTIELLLPYLCERRTAQMEVVLARAYEISRNKGKGWAATEEQKALLVKAGLIEL